MLVSHPPFPNPPPRGPTTSPPKMEVRRRMKVDFPHPESAATPMTMGVCPSFKAMLRLLEEAGARTLEPMKAVGAKAAAEAKEAAAKVKLNFMITIYFALTTKKNNEEKGCNLIMRSHVVFVLEGGEHTTSIKKVLRQSVFCGPHATIDRKVFCGSLPHIKTSRTFFDPRNFQKSRGCTDDVANLTKRYLCGHHVFSFSSKRRRPSRSSLLSMVAWMEQHTTS